MLTVIHVYDPTSASSDDEIEIFYDSIEHALTQTGSWSWANMDMVIETDISSDHSLVLCNIKIRLKRQCIKPQQNHRPDVNQLKNQKTRKSYQARLGSRRYDI